MPAFHATILTLFPEMFPGPLAHSLAGKALEAGIWSLETLQIRDFATGPHQKVDDTPYGGGAGMVMKPDVIDAAIKGALHKAPGALLVYFTPRGAPLTQKLLHELVSGFRFQVSEKDSDRAKNPNLKPETSLILLCGRYEGIDQRVLDHHKPLEISLGDYVLSGGEMAALTFLDACIRLLPGVVGKDASIGEESFGNSNGYDNLLEYPLYTKPAIWNGIAVPEVLTGGNHAHIEAWRRSEAEAITRARRPDLWEKHKNR